MNLVTTKKILSILVLVVLVAACVQDDDFKTPPLTNVEPAIDNNLIMDVGAVLGQIAQANGEAVIFEDSENFMKGYVVSSDRSGNFFEELIVQDKPENPTAGIRILVDVNPLFTSYEFGRKVFIRLQGLSAGVENGVATLGVLVGNEIDQIPSFSQEEVIKRSAEVATIVPLEINIEDFSDAISNLYVTINNVQFNRNDVLGDNPLTFASEASDNFDGERKLESCNTRATAILSTSTFADFKGLQLPAVQGSFEGILTKNFFGDTFNLVLNDPTGLVFENDTRCDPQEISCGLASMIGSTNLFSDNFETQSINSPISGNGWTNFIEEGTETWEAFTSTGNNPSIGISARVAAFGSGDANTIAWLISPAINLDAQDGETLRFQTSNSFADNSELDVLFSKDWDGTEATIATATWGIFTDATIVQDADFFGNWIESGNIDLSCETGSIYIAFRYRGNDADTDDFNGTYELDEISIDAN
ncbi:DUF5689 domain-containing protein [Aquimarina sp. RZ0]|uniref:DUF5689 domain-containing protein n=1 Tax=Aquimarina sp. RZ0 TaxID=2607730 RepID=UPI0011F2DC4A|nr:DUF5689 domain-containing protein [Aquimarina sp. RZ0]KAA1247299.1 hypothetical protein F0000_03905 [Aquimarina sp. RZ0]